MTSLEKLLKLLSEQGMQEGIMFLSSGNFSEDEISNFIENYILVGGFPCLSVLSTFTPTS